MLTTDSSSNFDGLAVECIRVLIWGLTFAMSLQVWRARSSSRAKTATAPKPISVLGGGRRRVPVKRPVKIVLSSDDHDDEDAFSTSAGSNSDVDLLTSSDDEIEGVPQTGCRISVADLLRRRPVPTAAPQGALQAVPLDKNRWESLRCGKAIPQSVRTHGAAPKAARQQGQDRQFGSGWEKKNTASPKSSPGLKAVSASTEAAVLPPGLEASPSRTESLLRLLCSDNDTSADAPLAPSSKQRRSTATPAPWRKGVKTGVSA